MLECLGCGKAFAEHELDAGKCTECRKRKVDLTAQRLYDHQQNTQIRSDQQQDENEQQERWEEDYQQEKLRQEALVQTELEEEDLLIHTLEDAFNRYKTVNATRGKVKNNFEHDL